MPTTVGRSRGRQGVHSGAQGAVGDHMRKIMATMIAATVVIMFVLVATKAGTPSMLPRSISCSITPESSRSSASPGRC